MKVYAIRHIPTGQFMPAPTCKNGSGSSYWEPITESTTVYGTPLPRLFPLRRSASSALTQWLRGQHKPIDYVEHGEFYGRTHLIRESVEIIPVVSRKADDMEIVAFELVEVGK